jgi:hypothetical protein
MFSTTRLLSLVGAALLSLLLVSPALAQNTVTQTVTCPTAGRTASIANLNLADVAYSESSQTSTGTMGLSAADASCLGLGWNVTVLSGGFTYSGSGQGETIPATNFALTSAGTPVMVTGQPRNTVGGPNAATQTGTFNNAIKTISAAPLFGQGSYTEALGVSLTIPARSAVGTYTATLTVSISAGP